MSQLESILAKSNLNVREQKELLQVLEHLSAVEIDELLNFLDVHPEWVEKLYYNYKQKKEVVVSGDHKKWQEIFDREKKDLEKL